MSIKAGSGSTGGNYLSQIYLGGHPILSQSYTENFSDGIGLTDSHVFSPTKVFMDSIGLTEVYNKLTNKSPFTDGIGVVDIESVRKVLIEVFVDSINVVDDFFTDYFQFFSRLFTDGIGMADTLGKKLSKLLTFVDNISIAEVYSKAIALKAFVDQVVASEALTFVSHLSMVLIDTISAIDTVAKKVITAFSDGIGAIDSGFVMPIKRFVDSISLSDSLVKSVRIVLSSIIRLNDSIKRRLNGMLLNWEKTFEKISDWTKRALKIDTMTKVTKDEEDWTDIDMPIGTYDGISRYEDDWTKRRRES